MKGKDQFTAAKFLLDFIQDFTFLTELLLAGVRRQMIETVDEVMVSIQNISAKTSEKISEAEQLLIREDVNDQGSNFQKSTFREVAAREQAGSPSDADHRLRLVENELRRAGGRFSKQMEAISTLDDEIKNVLMSVVGSVSADDVIGQRLEHSIIAIQNLNLSIAELLSDFDSRMSLANVRMLRNVILTKVYKSFTTEDERHLFHSVFGMPKKKDDAAA